MKVTTLCYLVFILIPEDVGRYSGLSLLHIHRCQKCERDTILLVSCTVNHIVREPELFMDESEPELLLRQALSIPTVQHSGCRRFHHHPFRLFRKLFWFWRWKTAFLGCSHAKEERKKRQNSRAEQQQHQKTELRRRVQLWVRACQPGRRHHRSAIAARPFP